MSKRSFQSRSHVTNRWKGYGNTENSASNVEIGSFLHACEGEMLYASTHTKIPYFNAPVYLENKCLIGKIDEILGPINQIYFTVKPQEGIIAASFHTGDKVYIGNDKLLPLEKFLPQPKSSIVKKTQKSFSSGYRYKNQVNRRFVKKNRLSFNKHSKSTPFKKTKNNQSNPKKRSR
ncbi:hypothetical protein PCK1_000257 [Pneumocystis canis]|nr:hypothetical protein PCK1_000257 [Pneumocystis canis]